MGQPAGSFRLKQAQTLGAPSAELLARLWTRHVSGVSSACLPRVSALLWGRCSPHMGARTSSLRLSVMSSDGNRMRVLLLRVHPHKHACVGTGLGVRACRSVCVCVPSTNMFSASSRSHHQSSLRNLSNSHPQKRLLPAGAEMSQQRQPREEESSHPGAGLSLLPAWPPRLGHCLGTNVPEHIPGTGQYRRLKGFPLLLPLPRPVPSHPTPPRPFIFPSRCKTKTPHSPVRELQPNGRSWQRRVWDMGAARAPAGQGSRTPPARQQKGPCWGLPSSA